MENRGYYIIDGSCLFSSIHELWNTRPEYKNNKLDLGKLSEALMRKWSVNIGATIRINYYFKKNEPRMDSMLIIPQSINPGVRDHWQIKQCAENVRNTIPQEELLKLSPKYRDLYPRSEKGLDIKLTCDTLIFAASNKASNFVFLVNDRDYVPLFEAIQTLGGNVYLTALDSKQKIHEGLSNVSDRFLTLDEELPNIFGIEPKLKDKIQLPQQVLNIK